MKTVGIICEYNPFHLGHARQLHMIREKFGEDTRIVGVMSGNYVQRGAPAMWDKYTRAAMAVSCGVDVVLELPITHVLQSAEGFAQGGVEILRRFGGVEFLCFGAECGDGDALMHVAEEMENAEFSNLLRSGLDQGLSYAAARQAALSDQGKFVRHPNDILGVEYCRAILKQEADIKPFVIQRTGSYHELEPNPIAPSATAVRALYPDRNWKHYVPDACHELLDHASWYRLDFGERAVLGRLRGLQDTEWEQCAHGGEGLWSKAMKAARSQPNLEAVIQATKSKRYPMTRIQRLLLCAYLGITQEDLQTTISYGRILDFSSRGRVLLREARERGALPLVNTGQRPPDRRYYALEQRASDLFTLFAAPDHPMLCGMEQNSRVKK